MKENIRLMKTKLDLENTEYKSAGYELNSGDRNFM